MQVGSIKQKANWYLVGFVFTCIAVIIVLLQIEVKAVEKAESLSYNNGDFSAYLDY